MMMRWLLLCCIFWAAGSSAPSQAVFAAPPDFIGLSQNVLPTTVHIRVERGPLIAAGIQQMARDKLIPTPRPNKSGVKTSTGSGVIFDKTGLILTNHHVINGAATIQITLYDQRVFMAEVVASDPRTDLAIIQILGEGPFPEATFNTAGPPQVGEWVVAVGHPFNFPFTVTAGIVSALGRRGLADNEIQDYIQTDVAVNPGSSGGPLFNTAGQVVGINTAIFSPDKENLASAGISFAIPAAMAMDIGTQLASGESIGSSGIGITTINSSVSKTANRRGARITRVIAGSPAEKSGLRRGDVIFSLNGRPISGSQDFKGLLRAQKIGTKVRIIYGRGSKEHAVRLVTVDAEKIGASSHDDHKSKASWAGLSLSDTTPQKLSDRGISLPADAIGGVLITQVSTDSAGAIAGLLPGDVILSIQNSSVESVDDLLKKVENHPVVLISFWRGQNRYLAALANR